jgi:apolipoprotein D and lipocalin family protein
MNKKNQPTMVTAKHPITFTKNIKMSNSKNIHTPPQIYTWLMIFMVIGLSACATIPKGAVAVTSFDKSRYLGKWYEIARLDFIFEKDLINTTAEYSLNSNGTIKVVNTGYDTNKNEWTVAIGKAKFVGKDDIAMLKVSFFGPFYGGYNVIALDSEYRYAMVAGGSLKNLWILSRNTQLPEEVKTNYLKIAEEIGYTTANLVWVQHDKRK